MQKSLHNFVIELTRMKSDRHIISKRWTFRSPFFVEALGHRGVQFPKEHHPLLAKVAQLRDACGCSLSDAQLEVVLKSKSYDVERAVEHLLDHPDEMLPLLSEMDRGQRFGPTDESKRRRSNSDSMRTEQELYGELQCCTVVAAAQQRSSPTSWRS